MSSKPLPLLEGTFQVAWCLLLFTLGEAGIMPAIPQPLGTQIRKLITIMFSLKVQRCLLSWKLRTERVEKGKERCSLSQEVWYWEAGGLVDCRSALLMPFADAWVFGPTQLQLAVHLDGG